MPDTTPASLRHPGFIGRIGIARREITPPVGIHARTWGSAQHEKAEGVHRPLLGTCVLWRSLSGEGELALLALDAIIFWQRDAERMRARILERTGLKPEQLILHPSHSHSTPFLGDRHSSRPGGELLIPYRESLLEACCELITAARANASVAILTWAYGRCGLAFNRDAVDTASGRDICGLNLLERADDTVLVGRVTDMDGRIQGTIVNYACHPVSLGGGNRLLSPDYAGAMREVVERETGAPCVFFHGASGDLTPRRCYEANVEVADQNGRELGYAALSTLAAMFPPGQQLEYAGIEESGTPLGVWRLRPDAGLGKALSARILRPALKLKPMPTREEIRARMEGATERYELERLERAMDLRDLVGDGTEANLSVTVWQLGGSFIVATPAEPYSRFQIELRTRFPHACVAVLNASDGCMNYLPPRSSYGRDVYQVRVALFEPGALESVTEHVAAAIAAE